MAVYADESCLGNGRDGSNPGGAAGVIEYVDLRSGRLTRRDYWISEPATTNNRMALRSVIEAFRGISSKGRRFRVVFTSDSQYLVKGMDGWVDVWMSRGWTRKGGPIENLDLWQEAIATIDGHQPSWHWVRGPDRYEKAAEALEHGGTIAVFWNVGRAHPEPFKTDNDAAYERLAPELTDSVGDRWNREVLVGDSAACGMFEPMVELF